MSSSGINMEARFSPNQTVDKKNSHFFCNFWGFSTLFQLLLNVLDKNSSDLFLKYFCGFFDTPGVSGGLEIVELKFPIHKYLLDSN